MKLNKLAMVLGFGLALAAGSASADDAGDTGANTGTAKVANQGSGTVKFTGSIIDAPCSIKNTNVEVDMGAISSVALKDGGRSASKSFKIELEGCTFETKGSVQTTFNGPEATEKGLLAIEGTAQGAAIAITNHGNKVIPLGEASDAMSLHDGNNDLNFAAHLKGLTGEDKKGSVTAGNFTAIANFTLNYQ
ncbi:fimbrial protein [Xenorhabdus kozodoii]|uniref:Major fimbrial subunit polypeptide, mrfA n=1 Tax=Xenorhabdus kozodoii TaxID=351676 RepID=A0A2D0L4P3_9GAMM|nr:fimbrial protein [Xenorhabdus kozodoii]PHM70651.1 major fimbrial subunit polypeptide, mrfA [Xenorhabdus kozodoii]